MTVRIAFIFIFSSVPAFAMLPTVMRPIRVIQNPRVSQSLHRRNNVVRLQSSKPSFPLSGGYTAEWDSMRRDLERHFVKDVSSYRLATPSYVDVVIKRDALKVVLDSGVYKQVAGYTASIHTLLAQNVEYQELLRQVAKGALAENQIKWAMRSFREDLLKQVDESAQRKGVKPQDNYVGKLRVIEVMLWFLQESDAQKAMNKIGLYDRDKGAASL